MVNVSAREQVSPSKAGVQRARILEAMRQFGRITALDFRAPTCDGGPEIHNITPRISEIRRGYIIETDRLGPGGIARYRLLGERAPEPEADAAVDVAVDCEQAALFEPVAAAPRCALDPWDGVE